MKFEIIKDFHRPNMSEQIASAWDEERLLVICPPQLKDHSFEKTFSQNINWPAKPVLGVFTSGTLSARPRLALYSRENILSALQAIYALYDRSRIDTVYCYPQPFHTFGLTLGYVASHLFGWRLIAPIGKYSRQAHHRRLEIESEKVLTLGTPTHFYDLIRFCQEERVRPRPTYSAIIGGASVSPRLWLEVQRELSIESPSVGYGCTEASPGIAHLAPGIVPTQEGEIGRPLASLSSQVTSSGVRISGPSLCLALVEGGKVEFPKRLTIRDQVHIDHRGSWYFLGRLDLTLNRGGVKYSLESIERDLTDVLRSTIVATALRDDRLGEELGLVVLEDSRNQVSPETVRRVLIDRWGFRIPPEHVRLVRDLPLNECGKLDRTRLKEAFRPAVQESIPAI
ncbi:MAG: AMP-binding protein [Bdellovibrionales bacterium]